MSRWVLAAIAVLRAMPLLASVITIEPKGPIYRDDVLTITVATNDSQASLLGGPSLKTENLEIRYGGVVPATGSKPTLFQYTAKAGKTGPAWIEADLTVTGQTGAAEHVARVSFEVLPEPWQTIEDPAAIFAAQKAAKRTELYVTATAGTYRAYPGQRVELQWSAVTPEKSISVTGSNQRLEGEIRLENPGRMIPAVIGARTVWQTTLHHVLLTPTTPGVVHIPEFDFSANGVVNGLNVPLRRFSNPIDIEVLSRPPEAGNLAIGEFRLKCSTLGIHPYRSPYWPSGTVEIIGTGELGPTNVPRLVKELPVPVILAFKGQDHAIDANHAVWHFEFHSRDATIVTLPDVIFEYFNSVTQRVEQASCPGPDLPVLEQPNDRPPRTDTEPRKPERFNARLQYVFYASIGLLGIGLVMVFIAMRG